MPASVSQDGRFRAVFLSVIMVLMTQVGYTDNMDFSLNFDEENELLETGGSTSNSSSNNLSPSRDNVVATVGEPMAEISWYHDVSPSGGNAGTTTQGNGSTWIVNEDKYIHSVNRDNNIATTIGDTFYYVATGGDRTNTSRIIYSYNKSTDTLGEVGTFGTMPAYSSTSYSGSRAMDLFTNAGGILLFDGPGIDNITAYNPANNSSYSIGVSYGGSAAASDGTGLSILVEDTLYFAGVDSAASSVGAGLYAYTAGNNTAWLAADINPPSNVNNTTPRSSKPGFYHGFRLIGDTIYFDGSRGHHSPAVGGWQNAIFTPESSGLELFAYNPSNHTSWQVTDIDNRSPQFSSNGQLTDQGNGLAPQCYQLNVASYVKNCNQNSMTVVGDTLFFAGRDSNSDIELWAHDTSNHSTWQVANINTLPSTEVSNFCQSTSTAGYDYSSSAPGGFYTIGDTVYFTATNGFYNRELWAYDTSNNSVWQVTRFYRCDDAGYNHFDAENNFNIVGDELFFIRDGGLYIHNDSTQYTKRLWTPNKHHRDAFSEWLTTGAVVVGDTLYGLRFSVSQPRFNYAPTDCPPTSLGGCLAQGSFLYAYDSSNETFFRTAFTPYSATTAAHGGFTNDLIIASGDTIFFSTSNIGYSSTLNAYQPAEISYPKERVSEANCTISPTLPAGLNLDSTQCTISGTPTAPTSQASYTVTAVINNTTYQGNVLLATSYYPIEPSVTGSDAKIGTPIDDITFQIDPMVGISSGSGGNSESSGSDSSNGVICGAMSNSYHTCLGTVRNWHGSDYRSDYGTGLSFDWSSYVFGELLATNQSIINNIPIDSAVDSNGHVHIVFLAYHSAAYKNTLTYVTNQSGSWQSFEIDDSAYYRSMNSIAIDSNDNVHIVYYSTFDSNGNNVGSRIKYATNENGSWVTSVVTTDAENPSSIAIDSQDNLHIAFIGHERYGTYDQGSAQIANYTNGSWTVSTVYTNSTYATSTDYETGRRAVLAIDSNDSLHLSWGVEIDNEMVIHYSSNQSGTWSDTVVDIYGSNADQTTDSILVDSNDNLHILHHMTRGYTGSTGAITHYTQENGTWTNSTAYHSKCAHGSDNRPATSCEIEAVIDSNDVIHIAYEVEEINTATQHSSALTKVQYSNNANGYFSPGVDVYTTRNVANMVVHSNGDVDFIYLLENHPPVYGAEDKLMLASMNNSELNPALPMYENNKIATGYNHSCGILHDNSLVCWGSDYYGQLGDGGTNTDRPYVATYLPVDLGTDRTALAVAAGYSHTCAILDDGSLKCWGDNSHGQLGDGSTTDRTSPVQVDLGSGNTAVAISTGHSHTCAILQDGTLKCWGQDSNGQVGDGGTNSDQSSPVTINLGSGRTADMVSTGIHHTCAVLDDGSIKCWGLNNEGQLGDGSTTNSGTPVSVNLDAGKTAYAVAAGLHHTCAIVDDHVECWGGNDQWQLKGGYWGNPGDSSTEPVVTATNRDYHTGKLRAISAGYNHTCLVTDYAMNCWGNLSDTSTPSYQACPRYDCWHEAPWIDEDIGLENETHIAVSSYGNRHCAITSFGKVVCRGYFAEDSNLEYDNYMTSVNHEYQFWYVDNLDAVNVYQWNNTADAGSATSPNMVSYDDVKYKISGGGSTTAGQMHTTSGQAMCLVHSTDIHNAASRDFRDPFYYSFSGSDIDQWNHRDGSLVCRGTGLGFGELHSRSISHFASIDIPEERTVEYISPGNSCVILDDGSLMCWGYNYHGQVGDGTNYSNSGLYYKYSPVYVDLGAGRTAVAVDNSHNSHACAILDNGAVKCWGQNGYGQLGDGSTTNSATPVSVSLPAGRTAVALAGNCVILDNASVMCWGNGNGGSLGNANSAVQTTPVYVDLGTNRIPVKIASGGKTCVVFDDGSLTCWGGQSYGQTLTLPENYTLPAGRTAFDVAIGEESNAEYVYVHLDDNRVCRKTSYNGDCNYVGYSHLPKSGSSFPYESTDLTAVAISAGDGGLCAVLVNGMLRCTDGQNLYGTYAMAHTYDMVGGFSNTGSGSGGHSSGGMTGISGATCTVSPALPAGLSIDSSTCTISGTPTAVASNTTYTIVATLNNVNYQGTFWLSSAYHELTPSVEGANLTVGNLMDDITFQYDSSAASGSGSGSSGGMANVIGATCTVSPALPTGLSINGSTCTISGTPTVETSNTTYTVTANISGTTYQGTVWLATVPFGTITSPVMGAELDLGEAMTPITLNYTVNANSGASSGSSSGSSFAYANNKLSTGGRHTCAILDNGDLMCWGRDTDGQLGTPGTNTNTYAPSSTAIDLGTGRTAVAVSAGEAHSCAILDNGDLKCWGDDDYGQLGLGSSIHTDLPAPSPTAIDLGTGRTAVAVSAGKDFTCAILDNGDLKCWGKNGNGQLGTGNQATQYAPPSTSIDLGTGRTAVAVSAGGFHTCAILDNGDLKCWGDRGDGQLGLGLNWPTGQINSPVSTAIDLGTGRTAVAVSAGDKHTCAILDNGDMKCWGYGNYGQLGDGSTMDDHSPVPVDLGTGRTAVAVSAGYDHTCAILDNGDMKCWGQDSNGQLGDGSGGSTSTEAPSSTPIDLGTGRTAVAASADWTHTCAILDNGDMKCWGRDDYGQLGDGGSSTGTNLQHSPVLVSGSNTWDSTATATTWEIHPELPEGMTLVNGVISGTPSVYAVNQTYTIYANQSGETTTFDMYFSVDTNNPHTVVENQPIDAIGFQDPFQNGTTNWTVSPALPADLVMDPNTGEITGSVNGVLANTTYTVTATHSDGATEAFAFSLQSLADFDGDGLPNDLPSDYDAAQGPISGLVADADDDADGLDDVVETNTGFYINSSNTGTDPLDPDTDGDRICDGPNSIPNVCVAGPDTDPFNFLPPPTFFALEGLDIGSLAPYLPAVGGTYEISPDLPASLVLDSSTGEITGVPTENLNETTFTVWINMSDGSSLSWDFTLTVLEDSDGDGMPDYLPDDYDPSNPDSPGLIEDMDNDNDGILDSDEIDTGTSPTDPDTDGDGMCDGPLSIAGICDAGPDAFPLDPSADTDTDGDGMPDTITGNSTSVPALVEDMDDDGDGLDDEVETSTWIYNSSTDTGTNPLNPDTDYDGTCDGPVEVFDKQGDLICEAGPDTELGNLAVGAHYAVNGSMIQSIRPEWRPTGAVWEVSPDLPADLTIDPESGVIYGAANEVTENITYTIYGNGTFSDYTSTFNLQVLEDTDRDGEPNELPEDYDNSTVTPMVEDLDDDNDGLSDLVETGTGVYNGTSDYGTDPQNPDTDGDGICDGPNSIWPICINGPDSNPFGFHNGENIVLVENIEIDTPIQPPNQVTGAVWEISPALPAGLNLDTSSGIITGTATEVSNSVTYTLWANVSDFGRSDSVAISVMATFGLTVLEDSDADGLPNELPEDYDTSVGTLVEDDDDDNDGMLDTEEDILGTDPTNPDSDGDGFCDGPADVYSADGTLVCRGPDSAPLDSALPVDTDGDMLPDEDPDGPGGLEADPDDDDDGHLDTDEEDCGSLPLNATSIPQDMDGDEICDGLDEDIDGDGIFNILETNTGVYNSTTDTGTDPRNADTDGDGICDGPSVPANGGCVAGADAFPFDPSASKDTDGDGMPDTLTGTSTSVPPLVEDLDDDDDGVDDELESDCDTDPLDAESVPTLNDDGSCKDSASSLEDDDDGGFSYIWCFPCLLILLLLLLVPLLIGRDRVLGMLLVGPEPENTTSEPEFVGGAGTQEDPFILAPAEGVKPGDSVNSTEVITIDKMSRIDVDMMDFNQEINGDRFSMFETNINEVGTRVISVGDDGEITINMLFDDGVGEPTYEGGEFTGLLKLGRASVYLSWTVTVEPDKKKLKEIEKQRTADEKAAKKAEEAEAKKMAKEEAAAKKKAEEEAAAAAKEAEEEEAAAAAALLAKEEEEAEAKKKAEEEAAAAAKEAEEEEAAAAALLVKEEEEAAKKKAKEEADAKKAKEAEEKAAAKKKADEEKAKKAEEEAAKKKAKEEADAKKAKEEEEKAAAKKKAKKPASAKEAKKQEELQRVKERAKTIDFKVIGKASSSELKSEVKKGAKTLEVANASEFADSGSAQITDEDGSSVISWTGKDGNNLTGVSGVKRIYGAASIVVVKDDLQAIKGIGPFIEEKLNALGITTYRQIANMNAKLEKQVNEAIEFFPGRVARDQWVAQAKILLGEDVKLDEKALKQAEELERVAKKAKKIDFKTIGVASASDRDHLQELKGIGPFIEEKLNALGIFKFEQIAKMTSKIEDEVNLAIEFFPGRVKRDQWVAQAKIKIGEDVELDEKALKKAEELERVAKKAEKIDFGTIGVASASDKDNLQELKGIGPFIEEKLNALGIYKFEQIAKMTSKIEDEVNIAIEFFPGRVKRDEWVKQAKERTK